MYNKIHDIYIRYSLTQQPGPLCDAVEATVGHVHKEGDHPQSYYHLKWRKREEILVLSSQALAARNNIKKWI
jgi:hypothetical protein